jgi:hypothetical protein
MSECYSNTTLAVHLRIQKVCGLGSLHLINDLDQIALRHLYRVPNSDPIRYEISVIRVLHKVSFIRGVLSSHGKDLFLGEVGVKEDGF